MGFYYFIILILGIIFILGAGFQAFKHNSMSQKRVIFLSAIGILLVGLSIFLFTPGSSEIIAEILRLE